MPRYIIAAVTTALAGCTTVSDLREEGPAFVLSSGKDVQAISACVASNWAARSGSINTVPRANGTSLSLSYVIFSNTVAAATVDIDEEGQSRQISVFARGGESVDKLRGEVEPCS